MIKQSDAYYAALYESSIVKSYITGEIVALTGEVYEIQNSDIIPGSLSKNNKCVNGSSFEFGAVFQGELDVTLRKELDRYKIKDGSISFTEHRYLADGTVCDVAIGKFYIAQTQRSSKLITIKATDRMDSLDADIEDNVVGTPYELLSFMAEKTGVELAQTEAEISALPNGTLSFSVYIDMVETWRDMVAYLGLLLGTFAVMTVEDKLEMRAYHLQSDLTIPVAKRKRNTTVVEDYYTYYRGVTARFVAIENYAPYECYDKTMTSGLIMNLGDIPILRGTTENKQLALETLLAYIKQIKYVPASFELVTSDATIELGDMLALAGENIVTYVTSYTWKYHGNMNIKGVGDNPKLKSSGDRTSKQLKDLEAKVSAKDIIVHSYTNASALKITDSKEVTIVSINFATVASTKPIFIATVPFSMELDGNAIIRYYLDGVLMEDDTLTKYVPRGNHFVTISNNLQMDANTRMTLKVTMQTEYFESDNRLQAAKILSFEDYINTGTFAEQDVDMTAPTANIAKGAIKAVLYSQGLAGTEAWDGTINIADEIAKVTLSTAVTVAEMADTVSVGLQTPTPAIASDVFAPIKLNNAITILGMTDVVELAVEESEE